MRHFSRSLLFILNQSQPLILEGAIVVPPTKGSAPPAAQCGDDSQACDPQVEFQTARAEPVAPQPAPIFVQSLEASVVCFGAGGPSG